MKREKAIEEILAWFQQIKRQIGCQLKQSDLTHAQWIALSVIREQKNTGIKKIAEVLGVSSSASTQLVDDLEKNKFVIRSVSKKDKREVLISLTQKAQKQFRDMHRERIREFALFFDALSDEEFATYVTLNKKIITRIHSL